MRKCTAKKALLLSAIRGIHKYLHYSGWGWGWGREQGHSVQKLFAGVTEVVRSSLAIVATSWLQKCFFLKNVKKKK